MTCLFCKTANPEGNKFCAECGASLDPTVGRLQSNLRAGIKEEVQLALETRLKDQKLVELETSLAVADRLSNWSKLFASFVGIPLAALALVLGFLGFHTYTDFANLVRDARAKITPELEEAKRDADTAAIKAKDASRQVQDRGDLAKQTSQSFSEVSKRLAEVSTLSGEVDQLKSRAGELTSKVGRLEQQFSKIGRVTILTNRPDGVRSLEEYLNRFGAESSVLSTNELSKIPTTEPDIIVVAAETRDSWTRQPQSALRKIFENYKIIAMGGGGSELFSVLGLEIDATHVMQMPSGTPLIVEMPALLKSPLPIVPSDGGLQVSQSGGDSYGVYDEGSPDIAGFEGIAKWKNQEHHWPIARQGNYLLWGFNSSAEQMTEAGKRLFVNLLINQKLHSTVPLSQARKKFEYIQPGLLSDRLNGQFSTNRMYFQVRRPGRIIAKVSWTPAQRQLALILNGPVHGNAFARKDGSSPLEIAFDVTDAHVSTGVDWQIGLSAFGEVGNTVIDYKLELSFPASTGDPR